jgi:hypothetical protein
MQNVPPEFKHWRCFICTVGTSDSNVRAVGGSGFLMMPVTTPVNKRQAASTAINPANRLLLMH